MLALIAALTGDGGGPGSLIGFGALVVGYVIVAIVALPRLAHLVLRRSTATAGAAYVLAIVFAFAALGEFIGVQAIVGVMLAGLAFNRAVRSRSDVLASLSTVGDLILVPFFLLSLGMLVDVGMLENPMTAVVVVSIALLAAVSKYIPALITQKWFGFTAAEGWLMFGLTVPHAAATSAIALVGREIGIFDDFVVTAAVIVILVSGICGAFATDRAGRMV